MRCILTLLVFTAVPLAALAQPAPVAVPRTSGGVITRDQFIQRAADMAGRRFDAMDSNHTGTVTRAQMRAFRAAHGHGGDGGQAAPVD